MMNRLSLVALVLSVIALGLSIFFVLKKDRVVYVDSIKLVANYNGAKALKQEFDLKAAQWKANLDTLSSELETEINDYQEKAKTLSPKQRQEIENRIEVKKNQYDEYERVVTDNAKKEDQRITTQVLKEITDFLKKYGKEHNYNFIMGATSIGNIVYASDEVDVTDDVLKGLNATYKR